jgi:hypothetical protein
MCKGKPAGGSRINVSTIRKVISRGEVECKAETNLAEACRVEVRAWDFAEYSVKSLV